MEKRRRGLLHASALPKAERKNGGILENNLEGRLTQRGTINHVEKCSTVKAYTISLWKGYNRRERAIRNGEVMPISKEGRALFMPFQELVAQNSLYKVTLWRTNKASYVRTELLTMARRQIKSMASIFLETYILLVYRRQWYVAVS